MNSIDPRNFDASVNPADDFYRFANGGWLDANPIPPEESFWGSFSVLALAVEKQVKGIVDEVVAETDPKKLDDDARRIRDFYVTGMDTDLANRLGLEPLRDLFALIDGIADPNDIPRVTALLHRQGIGAWFGPLAEQDQKQSEMKALYLYQGGLSLPDRDYYTKEDEKSRDIRAKYRAHLESMIALGGMTGKINPQNVIQMETELATASLTSVEMRDIERQYNKLTMAELSALAPHFAWPEYFAAIQVPAPEYVIVGQLEFMKAVDCIVAESPLESIKAYLLWHVLNEMANYLSEALERSRFDFYATTFRGTTEMKPRWRRVQEVTESMLGDMVGKLYVRRYFSEDAKRRVNDLVDHLLSAYRKRLECLDWMGDATKKRALEKLGTITKKLGYPDAWQDMSGLTVETDSYAANVLRACEFIFDREMRKVGKPVDRTEWQMWPQTVNAYYNPMMNEIVFPAGILQPPFFDVEADDALNFGAIGGVIGHEITHGFDDQGSLFDEKGNLASWWADEDREKFKQKAKVVEEQFNRYEPFPGVFVNGALTLGENIADLGGVAIAYDGLMETLAGKSVPDIDGFTPAQRFFLSWATVWRETAREEFVRAHLQTDPHAPERFRTNGPFSNSSAFYEAFGCRPGHALWRNPEDRAEIW